MKLGIKKKNNVIVNFCCDWKFFLDSVNKKKIIGLATNLGHTASYTLQVTTHGTTNSFTKKNLAGSVQSEHIYT